MTISCQEIKGDVWVVRTVGRLDQSLNPQLEADLTELLNNGHNRLIVDLSQTNYINSGGLRCLVTAWRKAREQEGDMVLCGLNGRLEEIFSIIGFDRIFSIQPTYKDARKYLHV